MKITILTATYNRASTLRSLYYSLLEQTSQDFEWLVIDDGSCDSTAELIAEFKAEEKIPINYSYQENNGKHTAINHGVSICKGEWVFIVDSDDALLPNACERIIAVLAEHETQVGLAGVCFRRAYKDGKIVGRTIPIPQGTRLSPTQAGNIAQGDLAYIFSREAMLKHPFPSIPNEKFVPELYIWNKIGDNGIIIFYFQEAIYLCEYLEDGYTKNFLTHLKRNPRGFLLYYRDQAVREKNWLKKIKCMIRTVQCLYFINCLKRGCQKFRV